MIASMKVTAKRLKKIYYVKLAITVRTKNHPRRMRASGVRGLLVYCSDYMCSHYATISAEQWPDDVRLSDLEPRWDKTPLGQK